MKIICLQENLKNGLITAERIIGKNLTLPILNNLLLKTDKGKLKISSTNLEIGINYWASGKIEKEGEITVPAKVLSSIVNQLPNKKIELEVKDGIIQLKCENYKAKIKGQSAKEFPIIPRIQPQTEIEINKGSLRTGLTQVVGMAAISEVRPEISGVLFSFDKNKLKLVATDSFRLAEKSIFLKNDFIGAMIVPQRTALELIRILSDQAESKEKEDMVKIIMGVNQVMFDLGYIQLISRLIDGQYPDYQQIIPKETIVEAIINREQLLNALKLTGSFSDKTNEVRISIKEGVKNIELFSANPIFGENQYLIPAKLKGEAMEIVFNWKFLLDGIKHSETESITIGLNGDNKPAIIRPMNVRDYFYIIMPIHNS